MRRGRGVVAVGVSAAVLATTGVVAAARLSDAPAAAAPSTATTVATAKVTRQDLSVRTDVDGILGYAGSRSVLNQLAGTVTHLPAEGSVVERGQSLYSVDNQPVLLFYGDVPAWRAMSQGSEGPDVAQLEANLVALGFASESELSVDDNFTAATTAAVKRWQKATGLDQTGTVELGRVVFLSDATRVATVKTERGAPAAPGAPVFTGTSTARVVQVDLDAAKQSLAHVGDKVDIKLPSSATTTGTIASIGSAAQTRGQGESAKQVVVVTVSLDDPGATGTLDQAPVRVGITSDSRTGVLTVPVNALLALAEGGYGVRAATGELIPVKTGLFARSRVEVSGDGLHEGMDVEVPAT
jgi:peptidoglycan hydrolase-like protein with peptidoglycan-binding domain